MFGKNKNKNTTRAPQINFSDIPAESNITDDSVTSTSPSAEDMISESYVEMEPTVVLRKQAAAAEAAANQNEPQIPESNQPVSIPDAQPVPGSAELPVVPVMPDENTAPLTDLDLDSVVPVVSEEITNTEESESLTETVPEVVDDISALETLNEEVMLETPNAEASTVPSTPAEPEEAADEPNELAEQAIIYSSVDDIDPDVLSDTPSAEAALSNKNEQKKKSDEFVPNPVEPIKLNLDKTEDSKPPKASGKAFLPVLVSILIVIAIVGFFFFTKSGLKEKFESPLTINNHIVGSDEFSFMYHYILIENGVDVFAKDSQEMLSSQSEDINYRTNRDYFLDITAKELQTTQLLYDDATKNGFKIEEKHYAMARAYVDWLNGKASELNIPLDTYIKGVFGSQVDEDCVVNTLAKKYFTEDYASDAKLVELKASSDQATEAYNANKNAYDLVDYKIIRITYEQRDEAFIATANLHANKIIENMGGDPKKFESAASEFFSGDAQTILMEEDSALVANARYNDVTHDDFKAWLFAEERVPGDTIIIPDEDGFPIILCFVKRQPQSVPLRNVKIIEVTTKEPDENGQNGFTLGEAQALAQSIYDYIADETKLQSVENYYTDEVLNGTIYATSSSDTYPGKFSDILDSWIFDPARKSGDKQILETDTGFYVVYFISESIMPEWYDRVNSFIRMNNYQAFLNEMLTEYDYEFSPNGLAQIYDVP